MTQPQPTNPNGQPSAPSGLEALSTAFQNSFNGMAAMAPEGLSEEDKHNWTVLQEARFLAECLSDFGAVAPPNKPGVMGGVSSASLNRTYREMETSAVQAGKAGVEYLTAETRRIAEIPDGPAATFGTPEDRHRAISGFSTFDLFLAPYDPYEEQSTPEQREAEKPRLSAVLDAMGQTAADILS